MLADFFKLNAPFTVIEDHDKLTSVLRISSGLDSVLFRPDNLATEHLNNQRNLFTNKTFNNVSFAKTRICGITFRDCLFIGTQFINCEFHDCNFKGCNPFKIEFTNTYIDPAVFEGMLDSVDHWNIGISLFQQLYKNAMDMHQRDFARTAEFNENKWRRYLLTHRNPGWMKARPQFIVRWLINVLFYIFAGYGIRARFLLLWAIVLASGSVSTNFFLWDNLGVVGRDGVSPARNVIGVLYYTVTTFARFGDLTPGSDVGKLVFVVETFLGIVLLSLFVAWLIRQALR